MAGVDLYRPCPGGCGKRIKFCCSRDLVHDIEKITRMIAADQLLACRDKVRQLLEKHPDRNCLLALAVETEAASKDAEATIAAIDRFVTQSPDNGLAIAFDALTSLDQGDVPGAVDRIQSALEHDTGEMPLPFYSIVAKLSELLIVEGQFASGLAYARLVIAASPSDDFGILTYLSTVERTARIPLHLRFDWPIDKVPATGTWATEFGLVVDDVNRGAWRRAAERLEQMNLRVLDQPILWRTLALTQMRLNQMDEAAASFRRYAELPQVPQRDKVWAESMAQVVAPSTGSERVDLVETTYPVHDLEQVLDRIRVNRLFAPFPMAPPSDDGTPPPRAICTQFDRPLIDPITDATAETISNSVGTIRIFGRETDRPARLVAIHFRDNDFMSSINALVDAVGDDLLGEPTERVIREVSSLVAVSARTPYFNDELSPKHQLEILRAHTLDHWLNVWPRTKNPSLGDRTPEEAIQTAEGKIAVLAALDVASSQPTMALHCDLNAVREHLGLPTKETIDPHEVGLDRINPLDYTSVAVDSLEPHELMYLFAQSRRYQMLAANGYLAGELLSRKEKLADEDVDWADIYATLANSTIDTDESLQWIAKARQSTLTEGGSPAPWLVLELAVRLQRREVTEVERIFREINSRHRNEPGVAEMLREVLSEYGMVPDVEQGPVGQPLEGDNVESDTEDGIWTPNSALSGTEKESPAATKLWLPGSQG